MIVKCYGTMSVFKTFMISLLVLQLRNSNALYCICPPDPPICNSSFVVPTMQPPPKSSSKPRPPSVPMPPNKANTPPSPHKPLPKPPTKSYRTSPAPQHNSPQVHTPDKSFDCVDWKELLATVNTFRYRHHVPPLEWDDELAKESTEYAVELDQCYLRHSLGSKQGRYSENLYCIGGYPKPSNLCTPAVHVWYNEVKYYTFSDSPYLDNYKKEIGHFTAPSLQRGLYP